MLLADSGGGYDKMQGKRAANGTKAIIKTITIIADCCLFTSSIGLNTT